MNGTTRCPYCETRFKITEAQLAAQQGMVRCGRCMQAFDARPTYYPSEIPSMLPEMGVACGEQPDIPSDESDLIVTDKRSLVVPEINTPDFVSEHSPDFASHHPLEAEFHTVDLTVPLPAANATVSQITEHHLPQNNEIPANLFGAALEMATLSANENAEATLERSSWPWFTGIALCVLLLLAQSVYFFRTGLAVRLPLVKPALQVFCHLLNCSVPLPQNAELISIESSGLEADPQHENQFSFNALLRNRAAYTQSFPELVLTLNDNQDMPVARRLLAPRDYLTSGENIAHGFSANHELSIKVHLNVDDLRPAGYRLELVYKK